MHKTAYQCDKNDVVSRTLSETLKKIRNMPGVRLSDDSKRIRIEKEGSSIFFEPSGRNVKCSFLSADDAEMGYSVTHQTMINRADVSGYAMRFAE